jgi:hypothetical protein
MCIGLDRDHNLELRLFGCIREIFGRRSLSFFPVMVVRSSSPSSLVARNHQNQCCAQTWGSCIDYRCNGSWNFVWF